MKVLVLILTILCFTISTKSEAQEVAYGIKGGPSLSKLGGDSSMNFGVKPGLHFGGVIEFTVSDAFLIQPEMLFSFQGSQSNFNNSINLLYLSFPVVVKYNVWDRLYLEAGPQVGVMLSNNVDDSIDTNSLDIGLATGAGYRLNDNFYFQARLNPGFINAIDIFRSKNRLFQVSAVYFF